MHAIRMALAGAMALTSVSAQAGTLYMTVAASTYVPTDNGGETIRKVNRGDRLAVACDGMDLSSITDVRVVLSFSDAGAKQTGYSGVLATDQTRDDGKLQIRVPDAPDLANHTMSVKVFAMTGDSVKSCDAGKVRVG